MVNAARDNSKLGMGRTWAKFLTLPAKKHRKFETATGKQTFRFNYQGRIR